ncbi:MAG: ATP-grasp domain-containing protein [Gemmatimonadota bacterium]
MTIEGRRRILLLLSSSSYRAEDFLSAAERLRVDVTVGSDYRTALADEVFGSTLELDFDDVAGSVEAVRRLAEDRPLSAVVAAEDAGTSLTAAVSNALELRGNSLDSVEICRRKDRFRLALADSDIPSPWYRAYPLETEPQTLAHDLAQELEFPCVVKPVGLSASRGVVRADDPEGLVRAFAEARRATEDAGRGGPILVEGYIPGDEVALEGILEDGALRTLAILDKPDPLVGPYFEETMFVTPSRLAPEVQRKVESVVARVTALVGLREGPIHAELRINEQGVWPIEIAPRTIGGLCARLFRYRTGTALEELVLLHALGRPLPNQKDGPASGVMMIPIPRAGILTSIEGIEAATQMPEVQEVSITATLGRRIDPLPRGNRYLGFIFARAGTPETVEQALRDAHSCLELHIEDGVEETDERP